jgi:hypothetical protein
MNALLRSLIVCATLLLALFASTDSVAGPRRSFFGSNKPSRYSIVEEYKGAYSSPSRAFGKQKAVHRSARNRRAPKR